MRFYVLSELNVLFVISGDIDNIIDKLKKFILSLYKVIPKYHNIGQIVELSES